MLSLISGHLRSLQHLHFFQDAFGLVHAGHSDLFDDCYLTILINVSVHGGVVGLADQRAV